jgi:hypothetical protein
MRTTYHTVSAKTTVPTRIVIAVSGLIAHLLARVGAHAAFDLVLLFRTVRTGQAA